MIIRSVQFAVFFDCCADTDSSSDVLKYVYLASGFKLQLTKVGVEALLCICVMFSCPMSFSV